MGLLFRKDGKNLNLEQVKAGLAWSMTSQYDCPIADAINKAEAAARAARRGLWSQSNPENPADFRHQ